MTNRNLMRVTAAALAILAAVVAIVVIGVSMAQAGVLGARVLFTGAVFDFVSETHSIVFDEGRTAHMVVDGDSYTESDVVVDDENANLIDSDTDNTDYRIVFWAPWWTGVFCIEIVHHGSA